MAAPAHTLPGDVPGLLRRGSPVFWTTPRGQILSLGCSGSPRNDGMVGVAGFMRRVEDLALDLTDPTGRIHALWWWVPQPNSARDASFESAGVSVGRWSRVCLSVYGGVDLTPDDLDTFTRVLRAAVEVSRG